MIKSARNGSEQLTPHLSTTIIYDNNQSSQRKIDPNNKELPKPEKSDITEIDPSFNIKSARYAAPCGKLAKQQVFLGDTTQQLLSPK